MLRKLGSYPRQNRLAVALRELGRIERTLFILSWLQSVELRRRVHAGLNKGEARNALARAVFLCRLGEIRDRSFEQQRYRASGLTLVTAAIALWNTVYIERAVQSSARNGQTIDPELFKYLSPLGRNTSISMRTTNGRETGSHRADSGHSESQTILNVVVAACFAFLHF
jgi:TnpA family transposase